MKNKKSAKRAKTPKLVVLTKENLNQIKGGGDTEEAKQNVYLSGNIIWSG